MNFKDLGKLYNEYYDTRKSFKRSIKIWLHDKKYYGYTVKVDSDRIRLEGTGERLSGDDISEFMREFNVVLTYQSKTHINNICDKASIYPEGEYYVTVYQFR